MTEIIPLKIIPLEAMSESDRAKSPVPDFISKRDEFFEPWGETQFWSDFVECFPQYKTLVEQKKDLFSVGYSSHDCDAHGHVRVDQLTQDKTGLFVGLCISEDFLKLPPDIKKQIAYHEVLHYLRVTACLKKEQDKPDVLYSKMGLLLQTTEENSEYTDFSFSGLEEAVVQELVESACPIPLQQMFEQTHPYTPLVNGIQTIKGTNAHHILQQLGDANISECIDFYDTQTALLDKTPSNDIETHFDKLHYAFEDMYFNGVHGLMGGMTKDEAIKSGKPHYIKLFDDLDESLEQFDNFANENKIEILLNIFPNKTTQISLLKIREQKGDLPNDNSLNIERT